MAMTKIKGLQMWCKRMTDGYPHVDINNFTTAWRDGMAFCALIHRFRPDLIDYDSLSPENVFDNCKMAFEVAEKELSIPAFLEASDMARLQVPDKLSVITYVSQYYNFLHALPQLGGPGVQGKVSNKAAPGTKRPPETDTSQAPTTKKPTTTAAKENAQPATEKTRQASTGDRCGICQNRVYLLERHIENGKLYHRSCFRHSELSPTNKVFTRSPFMSPSLNAESPMSPTHTGTDRRPSALSRTEDSTKDLKSMQKDAVKLKTASDISNVSKKTEGAGTKHSLAEPDREDTKKSKMHPKTLFGDDKKKNASAVKDRLENLRSRYSEDKNNDADNALPLPLSGKEARKLERRREEILASEKAASETPKGSKRNVPLIFQQKDKDQPTSGAAKSVLPQSRTTTATTATTSSVSSASSTAALTVNLATSKSSGLKSASKDSEVGTSHVKSKFTADKDSHKPADDKKLDTILRKKNALPDVQNLQKMFSGKADSDSTERSKATQPVARPRSGVPKHAGGDSTKNIAPGAAAAEANKDHMPKPAPRKSMADTLEKKSAPERPKLPPQTKKSTLHVDSSGDESRKSRSPSPRSPPALPKSAPPPLPTSAPPHLPSSPPKGEIVSKQPDKHVKKSTTETMFPETKLSSQPRKPTEDSKTGRGRSSSETQQKLLDKTTAFDKSKTKPSGKDSDSKITTHVPVKSQIAGDTSVEVRIKSTAKSSDRRWSSPVSAEKEPLAVFVVPTESKGEGQVLTGLLASLSEVRSRTSSSPSSTDLISPPVMSPSTSPPSLVNTSVPSSTHAKTRTEITLMPSSSSSSKTSTVTMTIKTQGASDSASASSYTKSQTGSSSVSKATEQNGKDALNTPASLSQPKSYAERKITLEVKDSKTPSKTLSSSGTVPTPTAVPEALNVLSSLKPVDGATPSKSSGVTSRGDIKLTKPGEPPSAKSPRPKESTAGALNQTKEKSSKEKTEKTHSAKASKDSLNLTDEKLNGKHKESENKSGLHPTPAKRGVIGNESKAHSTGLNKPLSSSLENLVDVNSVKLKRVMPEAKETKKEPKTAAFEVKLKKVDVIKGDEKWNNSALKNSRAPLKGEVTQVSQVTVSNDNVEEVQKDALTSGGGSDHVASGGKKDSVSAASSGKSQSEQTVKEKTSVSDDMPQWKKDIEERKRKLREDIARSEADTVHLRHLRKKNGKTERPKSADILSLVKEEDASQMQPKQDMKLKPDVEAGRPKSTEILEGGRKENELSLKSEIQEHDSRPDWKRDAESKMAALAGFESEEDEQPKDNVKPKRALPQPPSGLSAQMGGKYSAMHKSEGDLSTANDRSRNEAVRKGDIDLNLAGEDKVGLSKRTVNGTGEKRNSKLKDSELEFVVNKTKLKPVEVDIDISSDHEKDHDRNQAIEETGKKEDFRDKLQHLKHVDTEEEKVRDTVKKDIRIHPDNELAKDKSSHTPQRAPSKPPRTINGVNANNNSVTITVETKVPGQKGKSLMETVPLASSSDEDEVRVQRSESTEDKTREENEGKQTSPKVKRKITVLGRGTKGALESPPSSPKTMKKIEVATKFDFEKSSSDFEQSTEFEKSTDIEIDLTKSTAKLSISGKHTPPPRPPPPHPHHDVKSPGHISAIELQQQLLDIDSRLTELELRGRDLEDSIRNDVQAARKRSLPGKHP